jgi:hypothetical protein
VLLVLLVPQELQEQVIQVQLVLLGQLVLQAQLGLLVLQVQLDLQALQGQLERVIQGRLE